MIRSERGKSANNKNNSLNLNSLDNNSNRANFLLSPKTPKSTNIIESNSTTNSIRNSLNTHTKKIESYRLRNIENKVKSLDQNNINLAQIKENFLNKSCKFRDKRSSNKYINDYESINQAKHLDKDTRFQQNYTMERNELSKSNNTNIGTNSSKLNDKKMDIKVNSYRGSPRQKEQEGDKKNDYITINNQLTYEPNKEVFEFKEIFEYKNNSNNKEENAIKEVQEEFPLHNDFSTANENKQISLSKSLSELINNKSKDNLGLKNEKLRNIPSLKLLTFNRNLKMKYQHTNNITEVSKSESSYNKSIKSIKNNESHVSMNRESKIKSPKYNKNNESNNYKNTKLESFLENKTIHKPNSLSMNNCSPYTSSLKLSEFVGVNNSNVPNYSTNVLKSANATIVSNTTNISKPFISFEEMVERSHQNKSKIRLSDFIPKVRNIINLYKEI